MPAHPLEPIIEAAFERRAEISPAWNQPELSAALEQVLAGLNAGQLRVAEKIDGAWVTHEWIKKAVLLYFCDRMGIAHPRCVLGLGGGRRVP